MTLAWVFNLDAERELAAIRGGGGLRLAAPAAAQLERAVARLSGPPGAGGWVEPGDQVVDPAEPVLEGGRAPTRLAAWCPTPAVSTLAERLGLAMEAPPVEALITANARETFADLDPLPGAGVHASEAAVRAAVMAPALERSGAGASARPAWVLRRSLCCAGSGKRVVESWDPATAAWARGALEEGPVEVQPVVDVVEEFSVHGRVDRRGRVRLGAPIRWAPDPVPVALPEGPERDRLRATGREVGRRLAGLGYFGPFGVDGFRWARAGGETRLQVGTDVNARLTLHFAAGARELLREGSLHQEHLAEG